MDRHDWSSTFESSTSIFPRTEGTETGWCTASRDSHMNNNAALLWDSVQLSSIIYAELSITGSFEWEDSVALPFWALKVSDWI